MRDPKRRAGARTGMVCVVALLAGGCSVHHHGVAPDASAGAVAAGDAAPPGGGAGELLSDADRARLEQLCAARASDGAGAGYRLGPDDLVEVRVPDLLESTAPVQGPAAGADVAGKGTLAAAPTFQQGLRVDAAGNVTVATLGTVHAAGLTPAELEQEIARRLVKAGILDAPQVSVLVAEYRSRVAAVVGSVERPGVYPVMSRDNSLADLVWLAGGPTREAGRVVQFTPASADGAATPAGGGAARASSEPPIRMDLELLLHARGASACKLDPPARAGDVVSVSPAGSVQVAGWVEKPGSVPVTRGLTLTGALAAAGGEGFASDVRRVSVKRVLGPGEERTWTVDVTEIAAGRTQDVPLTDGDVITVPYDTTKIVPYGMWSVAKQMINIGGSIPLF